ncbi:MAG: phosphate ABC transporter substrate-binding protein [Phycisphaerae bacterium]|jgi:phosphate transport system substrate-binding protein
MKWIIAAFLALAAAVVFVSIGAGWGGHRGKPVVCIGSTSVEPFAEMLAEEFQHKDPNLSIDVQGGGSTAGIQAILEGIADIGMCSRSLNPPEAAKLRGIPIALDGLAVVVNKSNPVTALTRDQVRAIFSGEVARWSEVGGADEPIDLITREEGSGTREAFMKLVMEAKVAPPAAAASQPSTASAPAAAPPPVVRISRKAMTQESNGAVKELVKHNRRAIGYMSLGLVHDELKIITVDGVHPTAEAVRSKQYPLMRPFLFVVRGTVRPAAQDFIDYVLTPEGQHVLEKEGLVGVR